MLVHKDGSEVVCIGQAAHSWVSGQLVRKWGNERFSAPEPLAEVCLGAEQHDAGMAEWDRRPGLNTGTGWPLSFLELPRARRPDPEWAPQEQHTPDGPIRVTVDGPRDVRIDPWPFAEDELTIAYPGRRLFEPSATTQELHARLAAAPWEGVPVVWRPA